MMSTDAQSSSAGYDRLSRYLRRRSMRRSLSTCCAATLGIVSSGCLPSDHPNRYPMRLEVMKESAPAWSLDVDGDDRDELALDLGDRHRLGGVGPDWSIFFVDDDDVGIDQVNFVGRPLQPHALDLDGDGTPEILIPLIRNDSLFVSISDSRVQKQRAFLLTTGQPRPQPDGDLPWDPRITSMWVADVDLDGDRELITMVTTAFARLPRGVLVHDLESGAEVGRVVVGAPPASVLFEDFDEDGVPELLTSTGVSNHGAVAGGLRDDESYLMLYKLTPTPHVAWSRRVATGVPRLGMTDFDGDGRDEVLFVQANSPLTIEVLETRSWTVLSRRSFPEPWYSAKILNLDRDPNPEIVTVSGRRIQVIDDDLIEVSVTDVSVDLGFGGEGGWPDTDGDGVEEIEYPTPTGFALFDPNMRIKAVHPGSRITGLQRRGPGISPRFLIDVDGLTQYAILVRNPWYSVFRYGIPGGLMVSVGLLVMLGLHVRRLRMGSAISKVVSDVLMKRGGTTLLIADHQGQLHWTHPALDSGWTHMSASETSGSNSYPEASTSESVGSLARRHPELHGLWVTAAEHNPIGEQSARLHASWHTASTLSDVTVTPVWVDSGSRPHWIVWERVADGQELSPAETWPLMAQRVSHRLKNSLSHMLLTIQRLQAEYHDRAPAVANRFDIYADRIQDGIGQLKREASNLLKLVNVSEPDLRAVDVNELVECVAIRVRKRVPPDVRLVTDLAPDLPRAVLDREQIEEALENLVSNAVDSMPRGGTVTLGTADGTGLTLSDHTLRGDHVVIEVLDTGDGVSEGLADRLFSPGVTSRDEGTGLGLAIVRKIARDHGGEIRFHTDLGVGSVFSLHLPTSGPVSAGHPLQSADLS